MTRSKIPSGPIDLSPGQSLTLSAPIGTVLAFRSPPTNPFTNLGVSGNVSVLSFLDPAGNAYPDAGMWRVVAAGTASLLVTFTAGGPASVSVTAAGSAPAPAPPPAPAGAAWRVVTGAMATTPGVYRISAPVPPGAGPMPPETGAALQQAATQMGWTNVSFYAPGAAFPSDWPDTDPTEMRLELTLPPGKSLPVPRDPSSGGKAWMRARTAPALPPRPPRA